MQETSYNSPLETWDDEWMKLTHSEKALMLSYRRYLVKGKPFNREMVQKINRVHQKCPEFHMGCIPIDRNDL